jgi:hypothetical protein
MGMYALHYQDTVHLKRRASSQVNVKSAHMGAGLRLSLLSVSKSNTGISNVLVNGSCKSDC